MTDFRLAPEALAEAAAALVSVRRGAPRLPHLPDRLRPRSDAEGYAIQAQVTEAHHRAAGVFLAILRRFNAAGRRVSDSKNAGNYAPRQFAQEQEARETAVSKALLQHVMNDMLSDGTIRIAEEGAGGRTKRWLEIV